jgi:hypothetical protein
MRVERGKGRGEKDMVIVAFGHLRIVSLADVQKQCYTQDSKYTKGDYHADDDSAVLVTLLFAIITGWGRSDCLDVSAS